MRHRSIDDSLAEGSVPESAIRLRGISAGFGKSDVKILDLWNCRLHPRVLKHYHIEDGGIERVAHVLAEFTSRSASSSHAQGSERMVGHTGSGLQACL